jgi:hypothetical protein
MLIIFLDRRLYASAYKKFLSQSIYGLSSAEAIRPPAQHKPSEEQSYLPRNGVEYSGYHTNPIAGVVCADLFAKSSSIHQGCNVGRNPSYFTIPVPLAIHLPSSKRGR